MHNSCQKQRFGLNLKGYILVKNAKPLVPYSIFYNRLNLTRYILNWEKHGKDTFYLYMKRTFRLDCEIKIVLSKWNRLSWARLDIPNTRNKGN